MVENDAVNVTAYVRIYKDPTGVLWHNFNKYVYSLYIETICLPLRKLRFKERDWHGWASKPGCYMLPELSPTIALLYECFSQGMPKKLTS